MARNVQTTTEKNFLRGLITEYTALNFPENACTETFNCIFDQKARSTRRLGFDFEANYSLLTGSRTDSVISGYTWYNVAGDGSVSLRIQQVGDTLYFWNIVSSSAVSSGILAGTIDLNTYAASGAVNPALNECQFAAGNGYLFVVHPGCDPFYVTYNTATAALTGTMITAQIRDFEGLDDSLAVDERPTATVGTLTKEHKYNLFNQGWYFNSNAALTAWDTAFTTMPSNADIWWAFKDSTGAFATAQVANVDLGTTPAPKGHYVLDLFSQDRSTASGIASISTVSTGTARFSTVGFLNSRLFYSGVQYSGYSAKIYFSQILQNVTQAGYCYQENDPTSETEADLLPSDGGVIHLYGVEKIVKLWPLVNSLLVFATNGIWSITGSLGIGFSATDYTITKISSINCISPSNFVDLDGFPLWWTTEGIYFLQPETGDQGGGFNIQSLTDGSIRDFYKDLPSKSKSTARGAYNPVDRTVRWIYKTVASSDPNLDYEFDAALTYNLITKAFYPWTVDNTSAVKVHDIFVVRGEGGTQTEELFTDNSAVQVTDDAAANVIVYSLSRSLIEPEYKYFVSYNSAGNDHFTFAETVSTRYLDWYSYDSVGVDYDSYFITGFKLDGEGQRFFQSNYIFVFLEQETDASCFVQGIWDWTTDSSTGKWSTTQQVYNSALTNRSVNMRRLKLRGKGRSLQLKFFSETGKPFTIIGWGTWETSNASV